MIHGLLRSINSDGTESSITGMIMKVTQSILPQQSLIVHTHTYFHPVLVEADSADFRLRGLAESWPNAAGYPPVHDWVPGASALSLPWGLPLQDGEDGALPPHQHSGTWGEGAAFGVAEFLENVSWCFSVS